MTDVPGMKIFKSSQQLSNYNPQFLLVFGLVVLETGQGKVLHDKVSCSLLLYDVESFVFADRRMVETLESDEVPLHCQDVLLLQLDLFHGIDLSRGPVSAPINSCIASLSDLLPYLIVIKELVSGVLL